MTLQFRRHQSIIYCHTINIRQPQDHWLFVLLFTIRWTREMFLNEARPPVLSESLRFPQRGRQRERHNSFLCFLSEKLTGKIYKKRLTGQFNSRKKNESQHQDTRKNQVDLQTLQFFRSSGRNLKTVFPTLCNTTRQLHA